MLLVPIKHQDGGITPLLSIFARTISPGQMLFPSCTQSHTSMEKDPCWGANTPLRGSKPPTSSKALWGDSARTPLQIVKAIQLTASQKQQECLCAEYVLLPSLLPSLKITQEIQGGNSLAWLISPQTWESPSVIRTESGHKRHLIISKIPSVSNSETSETFFLVNSDYSKN